MAKPGQRAGQQAGRAAVSGQLLQYVISGLIGGGSAAAGAWVVIVVTLRYHADSIKRAQRTADSAHRRIDSFFGVKT